MDALALHPPNDESWLRRNRWRIGMVVVVVVGGLWWRRMLREPRISVGSVSERWLAEQAFEAGQRAEE
jgi:hypothetical protein